MLGFISKYWDNILLSCITAILLALGRWLKQYTKKQKQEYDAYSQANLILLRRGLYADIGWCRDHGYCPIWMRENIDATLKEYKKLGGNGMVEQMIHDIYHLSTKEPKGDK